MRDGLRYARIDAGGVDKFPSYIFKWLMCPFLSGGNSPLRCVPGFYDTNLVFTQPVKLINQPINLVVSRRNLALR